MKFLASTAMRTAVSTHVAEILRDAGPKVTFVRPYVSITGSDLPLHRENTSAKLPSTLRFTVGN